MNANTSRLLGKLPAKHDPRTIQLDRHATAALPPPPTKCRWDKAATDWGIMGNDQYGNCVIATAAHTILSWRANELGDTQRITDSAVIDLSRTMHALNGYNILDRLNYWRRNKMWAHPLWAFAQINPSNLDLFQTTINEFGAADIGLQLPLAWKDDPVWDIGTGHRYSPASWGLHSVPIIGYDANQVYLVTWGQIQPMTWRAVPKYCDEAYANISPDWLAKQGTSPSGFNLETLRADLDTATST